MTLLAAINLGDVALIVSDKKESQIIDGIVVASHTDAKKIIETDIGIITGSGWVDLLEPVKKAIANSRINHTDQVLELINNERNNVNTNPGLNSDQRTHMLTTTSWVMTYRTIEDDQCKMRVVWFHPSISESKFGVLNENEPRVIFPHGTSQRTKDDCVDMLSIAADTVILGSLACSVRENYPGLVFIEHPKLRFRY